MNDTSMPSLFRQLLTKHLFIIFLSWTLVIMTMGLHINVNDYEFYCLTFLKAFILYSVTSMSPFFVLTFTYYRSLYNQNGFFRKKFIVKYKKIKRWFLIILNYKINKCKKNLNNNFLLKLVKIFQSSYFCSVRYIAYILKLHTFFLDRKIRHLKEKFRWLSHHVLWGYKPTRKR